MLHPDGRKIAAEARHGRLRRIDFPRERSFDLLRRCETRGGAQRCAKLQFPLPRQRPCAFVAARFIEVAAVERLGLQPQRVARPERGDLNGGRQRYEGGWAAIAGREIAVGRAPCRRAQAGKDHQPADPRAAGGVGGTKALGDAEVAAAIDPLRDRRGHDEPVLRPRALRRECRGKREQRAPQPPHPQCMIPPETKQIVWLTRAQCNTLSRVFRRSVHRCAACRQGARSIRGSDDNSPLLQSPPPGCGPRRGWRAA